MTDAEIVPAYALIDYVWDLLKTNTDMKLSDYNGKIPVIPSSQQPDFVELNKPFLVFEWTESPSSDNYSHRAGQMSFAVYSPLDRDIVTISNLLTTVLGKFDLSASYINQWKVGKVYQDIRFTSVWCGAFDGPSPEEQEGGRKSGVVVVRYQYIANYEINIPGRLVSQP